MKLNKNHPDYPRFKRLWDELLAAEFQEVEKADEKLAEVSPCQDGLKSDEIRRTYNKKRSALQKKFEYIYEE